MQEALRGYLALADCGPDELSRRDDAARGVCELLRSSQASVLDLVLGLQEWLTSTDPANRAAGTKLLVEVLEGAPEAFEAAEQLHLMAEFLGARLADWRCAEPAARACIALVGRAGRLTPRGTPLVPLPEADGMSLLNTFATSVSVPPLARPERQACLQLWLALVQNYGVAAARDGTDVADATLAAIEEEKDPRCLLLAFEVVKATATVYHSSGVDPTLFDEHAEEVVGSLSCYFPVRFTPPKNDPHRITRQQLEDALEAALGCSPFLAKWALPLVLEKLSSTHRPAKEDALSALVVCCRGYGREAMAGHLQQVWSGLRTLLMAPSEPGVAPGEDLEERKALAAAAGTCLRGCVAALGPGSMDQLVLKDLEVGGQLHKILAAAVGGGAGRTTGGGEGGVLRRPRDPTGQRAVMCAAAAIAEAAAGSPLSCSAVSSQLLSLALTALQPPMPSPSQPQLHAVAVGRPVPDGQLCALLLLQRLLQSIATAVATAAAAGAAGSGGWANCHLVSQLPAVAQRLVEFGQPPTAVEQPPQQQQQQQDGVTNPSPDVLMADGGEEVADSWRQAQVLCCSALREAARLAAAVGGQGSVQVPGAPAHGQAQRRGSGLRMGTGQASDVMDVDEPWGVAAAAAGSGERMGGGSGGSGLLLLMPVASRMAAADLLLQWALDTEDVEEVGTGGEFGAAAGGTGVTAGWAGNDSNGASCVPSAAVEVELEWGRSAALQQEATDALVTLLLLGQGDGPVTAKDLSGSDGSLSGARSAGEQATQLDEGGGVEEQVVSGLTTALLPSAAPVTSSVASSSTSLLTSAATSRAGQSLAIAAQLSQRGPAALGRKLAGRWRGRVLASLQALGNPSADATAQSGALPAPVLCGVLNCLASAVLPSWQHQQHKLQRHSQHQHSLSQTQEAAESFARALLGGLSQAAPGAVPDGVAWAAAACVGQLLLHCSEQQQTGMAAAAAASVCQHHQAHLSHGKGRPPQQLPGSLSAGAGQLTRHEGPLPPDAATLPAALALLSALSASSTQALLSGTVVITTADRRKGKPQGQGQEQPAQGQGQGLAVALLQLATAEDTCSALVLPAAVALASLLNKAPAAAAMQGGASAVLETASANVDVQATLVLDGPSGLLQSAVSSDRCMRVLAWVCHALSMRGHSRASEPVELALHVLSQQAPAQPPPQQLPEPQQQPAQQLQLPTQQLTLQDSSEQADVEGRFAAVAAAAAELFGVVVSGEGLEIAGGPGPASAPASSGQAGAAAWRVGAAVAKPLWQQRAFSTCLSRILAAVEQLQGQGERVQGSQAAGAGNPHLPARQSPALGPLLALCHLVTAAPPTLVQNALKSTPRLAPALVSALAAVAAVDGAPIGSAGGSAGSSGTRHSATGVKVAYCRQHAVAVLGAIRGLSGLLQAPAGSATSAGVGGGGAQQSPPQSSPLEPHAPALVSALCGLAVAQEGGAAAVREAALRCLLALMERLPYHVLHPLRQTVLLRTVPKALDDPKRNVRKAAIACRRAWSIK